MDLWNTSTSVDREAKALEEKQKEIRLQIQTLQDQVQNLSKNKSSPQPPLFQEEEIRPLEGHHPQRSPKKKISPPLRRDQNRDRNLFFVFMTIFIIVILFIFHLWNPH